MKVKYRIYDSTDTNITKKFKDGLNIIRDKYSLKIVYYISKYHCLGYIYNTWAGEYDSDEKSIEYTDKKFKEKIEKHINILMKWAKEKEIQLDNVDSVVENNLKYLEARTKAREELDKKIYNVSQNLGSKVSRNKLSSDE